MKLQCKDMCEGWVYNNRAIYQIDGGTFPIKNCPYCDSGKLVDLKEQERYEFIKFCKLQFEEDINLSVDWRKIYDNPEWEIRKKK